MTLATSVPKGERFDWLVEKASELGVARLVPILTERSVVDPRDSKLERLRRLTIESAKQCGRNVLLQIDPPITWSGFYASKAVRASNAARLLAHPGGSLVAGWNRQNEAILAIGPEGGFTDLEVENALVEGWTVIGLGPTILRIETAALAGSSTLLALGQRVEP